ncbi:MAG: AMP-binding enzyme [Steroidobacteraceae bacterium]
MTAEKFVPDRESGLEGARLYRTGDIVLLRQPGLLKYVGRRDQQCKIRGMRVELGEIEGQLRQHPAVRECAVIFVTGQSYEARIVAYVVPATGAVPAARELRLFLRQRLPEYMVPEVFVHLEQLPWSPSGKVDRRRLPPPTLTPEQRVEPYVAPRTPIEAALVEIWEELLRKTRVGVHDNFFELGGHSIPAMRLALRARERFGVDLPFTTLSRLHRRSPVWLMQWRI